MNRRSLYAIGGGLGAGLFIVAGVLINTGQYVPGGGGGGAGFSISAMNSASPGTELGQVLDWSGTTWQLDRAGNPLLAEGWTEEFDGGSTTLYPTNCSIAGTRFGGGVVGTSACGYNNADTTKPSTVSLTTSTGANDGIRMSTQANSVVFGTIPSCVTCLWKIHLLSDATTQYIDRCGFAEPTVPITDSVDAVEAAYDWAGNGNVHKWQLTTRSNSVGTNTVCTGSTGDISADQWFKLKLCVNAAGTSSTLTVNDVLCATNSTNIPTGTARATAVGFQHANNAGGTPIAQLSFVDLIWKVTPFSVAR